MGARTRTKSHYMDMSTETVVGGSWSNYPNGTTYLRSPSGQTDYSSTCSDTSGGKGVDHDLNITTYRWHFDPLNGTVDDGYGTFIKYNKWHPPGFAFLYGPSHLSLSYPRSDGDLATELLARTNPNRYYVNGPVSFLELRDLPHMLKLQGDNIIQNAAGGYLSWQFGWKPLISDVKKLLDFNGLVEKKIGELHRLNSNKGLHRRRSFGTVTRQDEETVNVFNHNGNRCDVKWRRITNIEKWGTVRYRPASLPSKDESKIRKQAIRIVYGLELSPSNLWEALPWSWLVDWFSNVGDYLGQFNNVVPCVSSAPCIMTRTTTRATFSRSDSTSQVTGCTGGSTVQTKARSVVSPTISASLPFLTGRQLSILGSLAILRLR